MEGLPASAVRRSSSSSHKVSHGLVEPMKLLSVAEVLEAC